MGVDMKRWTKTLFVPLLACASALPLSSTQAWWGGPGWGGPWGYHNPWGYDNWTNGLGDLFADLWGDIDFRVHFSLYGSGHGYGEGYGHGYGDYYNHYGYGAYGHPGYWGAYTAAPLGGYPAYFGAYPRYGMPYAPPVAQPPVNTATEK